jgi:hypothetical protein
MNGDRTGGPPKPYPKGNYAAWDCRQKTSKPSIWTASEKEAEEGEAAQAHAERVIGDRAVQVAAAAAAKKRLLAGLGRLQQQREPFLGYKDTKRKRTVLSDKGKPKSNWVEEEYKMMASYLGWRQAGFWKKQRFQLTPF